MMEAPVTQAPEERYRQSALEHLTAARVYFDAVQTLVQSEAVPYEAIGALMQQLGPHLWSASQALVAHREIAGCAGQA
jgi:hypothetical protein